MLQREERSLETMDDIVSLTRTPQWKVLVQEAEKKLRRFENTLSYQLFKSRSPVDVAEVEYYRGFRKGVMYVLEDLPNTVQVQLAKKLAELDAEMKEVD